MNNLVILPILDTPYDRHNGGTWVVSFTKGNPSDSVIVIAEKYAADAERYAGPEVEEDDDDLRLAIMANGPWDKSPEMQKVIFECTEITALQLIEANQGAQVTIAIQGETVAIQTSDLAAATSLYVQLVTMRYGIQQAAIIDN